MDSVDPNVSSDSTGKISERLDRIPDAVTGSEDFTSVYEHYTSVTEEIAIARTTITREIEADHKEDASVDDIEMGLMGPLDQFSHLLSRQIWKEIEDSIDVTRAESTEPFLMKTCNDPEASSATSLSTFIVKSSNDSIFLNPVDDQSNPGKKRKYTSAETDGGSEECKSSSKSDGDGCKHCNCKKSQCLKRYCDCFAAGMYCMKLCACQGCYNRLEYEDTVLEIRQQIESRNVPAFAPKITQHILAAPASSCGDYGSLGVCKPSPKRDGDGCKQCSCKKTQCLKRYCDCFAAGIYCEKHCACQGCYNRSEYEDTILEMKKQIEFWNPVAFAPKITQHIMAPPQSSCGEIVSGSTPSSVRHEKGCNCKKSMCLQKYCECYQANVGCSDRGRCQGCKNEYGRKGRCD